MSSNKKYAVDGLIEAIGDRFDNIENYAKSKGVTKQNISAKVRIQSRKFIKDLIKDGINVEPALLQNLALQSFDNNDIQNTEGEMISGNFQSKTIHLKSNDSYKELIQDLIKSQREDVLFMRSQCIENQKQILKLLEELIKRRK